MTDYDVGPSTPFPTMASVFADMSSKSLVNATVCVVVDTATAGLPCPGGVYVENVSVPAGFDVDVSAEQPVCWEGAGAGVPVWEFDGASGALRDFQGIACQATDRSALVVVGGTVLLRGHAGGRTKVTCNATPAVPAAGVGDGGVLSSDFADYDETTIGVEVMGSSPTIYGTFLSLDDILQRHDMAVQISGYGVADLRRARVTENGYVGSVSGQGSLFVEHGQFSGNLHPTCGSSWAAVMPLLWYRGTRNPNGLLLEDSASATFTNSLWVDNCAHRDAQQGLIRAFDNTTLLFENGTTDNNEAWAAIQVGDSADAVVLDSIFADDANAYGFPGPDDNGIDCNTAGTTTFSHNAYWQLDTPVILGGACTSGPVHTADPEFVTIRYSIGMRTYTQRNHLGDGTSHPLSPYIDFGSRPATALYPTGGWGTEPNPPFLSSWVDDTGTLDLGWHWEGP